MSTSAWSKVDWEDAACKFTDTDSFYPEGAGDAAATNKVLIKICNDCPIISECANYAVHNEQHGFWGGLSPSDRLDIRKRKNILEPTYESSFPREYYGRTQYVAKGR
tara:strand:- start:1683 stop:2003 length:321 start_codon:yes stop_codon:yes gene_type:complete